MRTLRGPVSGLALSLTLAAFAGDRPPPPHPTALMVEYKGARHQVVAVEKEDPVILVDGKRRRLRGNIPLSTERQPRYAVTRAEVSGQHAEIIQLVAANSEIEVEAAKDAAGATLGGYVEYSATITAAGDLSDCFVALFAIDDDFMQGRSDQPNAQIRVREIPNLRANVATKVKFATSPFLSRKKMSLFVLVFAEGREVALGRQPAIDSYFHRRERLVHAAAVKQWLAGNATGNRPAQPVLQIPPHFAKTDSFPAAASAQLVIGADGTVSEMNLTGEFPPTPDRILREAMEAWLFLPQIKEGRPVATRVTVPLKY